MKWTYAPYQCSKRFSLKLSMCAVAEHGYPNPGSDYSKNMLFQGLPLRIDIIPSCSGTSKLLCRQWKIEDGARSHGLGEKGGKGLPFFNESLRSHWANHQGAGFLGSMTPTNVMQTTLRWQHFLAHRFREVPTPLSVQWGLQWFWEDTG